ncbi:MAG: hypothetical protein ONB16_04410 [candidate division KSB1 bacterium]|nr:hypothetical protein [candidate division KSB1 bacterium]MDZ7319435.1 hypothetical protein [candidate division KSB1 bacterium]MDZ7340631.1 hypothetical protein [candidate division KSB1 bacterium]
MKTVMQFCWLLLIIILVQAGYSQSLIETKFEQQMVDYESDVVRCYNELQQFLDKYDRNIAEMVAFESLLSIYVDRILEIFNTMERLAGESLETYRGVAARALIFRSLTYLERSRQAPENFTKAVDDYKHALRLYRQATTIPIMNKKLPYEVWIGRKMYTRLADLLDDKNKDFNLLNSLQDINE